MINKAINLDKYYAEAYSARSKINLLLFNIDSACTDRITSIKIGNKNTFNIPDSVCNGNKTQKLVFMAEVFAGNGLYKNAITAYSQLLNNHVPKSDYYLNRGYCYFQIKNFEQAEQDYLQALMLENPSLDLIYDNISLLYFQNKDYSKSIEYTTKRIELNPKNHVPYIDRGLNYRKIKKYKEAEMDFNKSLALKPNFFRAFGYRSFLYLELGAYYKSYEDALKAIEINPEYGYGYLVLAQAKQKLGLPDYCQDFLNAKKYGNIEADIGIKEFCQ